MKSNTGRLAAVIASALFVVASVAVSAMPVAAASAPYIVKNIRSGSDSSNPIEITALGDVVVFSARGGGKGHELYRSDGTAAGTFRLLDIRPGKKSSFPIDLARVGEKVFFSANDGQHGDELWVTDGTTAGTHLVKDIVPGKIGSISVQGYVPIAVDVGGVAYFRATSEGNLWRSDGTDAGTFAVPNSPTGVANLTAFGGRVYFGAKGNLWRSDGTADGTKRVKGSLGFYLRQPTEMIATEDHLFFQYNGTKVWRTDGTRTGTFKIKEFDGWDASMYMTSIGNTAFFVARGVNFDVWRSDGTVAGTFRVAELLSYGTGSFVPVGNLLYIDEATFPASLWVTDGWHFAQRVDVPSDFLLHWIYDVAGKPYYVGQQPMGDGPALLFETDGTAAGTVPVGPPSPEWPNQLVVAGRHVFFRAIDSRGLELWAMTL